MAPTPEGPFGFPSSYLMSDADVSDAERREMAEGLFEQKRSHNEIKEAIKLEEARRAAAVKNLYRLRSLRLLRDQTSTPKREE